MPAISFLLILMFVLVPFGQARSLCAQEKSRVSPRQALLTALTAKLNAKSYRLKELQAGTGEGTGVQTITTGDYVAPDKLHAIVAANSGRLNGSGETFFSGDKAYVRTPEGKWEKRAVDPQRVRVEFARLRHEGIIENLSKARDSEVKLAGKGALDGSPMLIYQYSYSVTASPSARTQVKAWVNALNNLPHKIEVEIRVNQAGLKFVFTTTTIYYDYNADIKMETPS